MKSIRTITQSSEPEKTTNSYIPTKPYQRSLLDADPYDYDDFDFDNYSRVKKESINFKEITIAYHIDFKEIGPCADENSIEYDWDNASTKASEIAYDKTEKLLGKSFESKYTIKINPIEKYDEYLVEVSLIPIN